MHAPTLFLNAFGLAATAFSIFMWVPQARMTWQNRNNPIRLAGISETTQWLSMVGALAWAAFGALSESFWVMAPSFVSFPLALATIFVVRRGRRLAPVTRSVPIISTSTAPLSVIDFTESVPVVPGESAYAVGEVTADAYPATGTVAVLA